MDTTNLRNNYPKLISRMENTGYKSGYISRFRNEVERILELADSGMVSSYADVYEHYRRQGYSKCNLNLHGTFVGAIEKFDLQGLYPDGSVKQMFAPRGSYYQLCEEYKSVVDCFSEAARKSGKRDSTIRTESNCASVFLLELQKRGVIDFADVTQADVLSAFVGENGEPSRRYACAYSVKDVLKTCVPQFPNAERLLVFLPIFKNHRKNIQYLTPEEVAAVKRVLLTDGTGLTLRDRAIGTLALYTGLRGCDMAALKTGDIDWEADTLSLRQSKTGKPLELPLTAIVGNALYDYGHLERPQTDCEYFFISRTRPYGRLKGGPTMSRISSSVMKAAGIRQNAGDRQGFHIFRHPYVKPTLKNNL